MKKSFIMTVAVSMALSAVATETGYISGTSFEDISLGEKSSVELVKNANDLGVVNNVCYWSTDAWKTENSADYEGFFVVTNIPDNASYQGSRPEYWATSTKKNALVIDTDKPLDRFIHYPTDGGIPPESLKDKNVFFDSVVQFTATDVSPTPVLGIDKLLVWLYTSPEDVAETNPGLFNEITPMTTLVVTAREYKQIGDVVSHYTTNYCVAAEDVSIRPDEWHRLTIKAFVSNDGLETALFNVYIDGKKVSTEDGKSDFISLNDGASTIIGVAFDGKGMVDDIAFTTKDPFYVAPEVAATYSIAYDVINSVAGVSVAFFTDENSQNQVEDIAKIDVSDDTIFAYVMIPADATLSSVTLNGTSLTIPTADNLGVTMGYNFELPLGTPVANASYTVVVTLANPASGSDDKPTIGGEGVTDANAFIAAANSAAKIKVPTGWTLDGNMLKDADGKEYATFADYYTVALASDGTVTLTLNDNAKPTISETATDKDDAFTVTDTAVTLGVTNAIPGLWYGAQAYDDVACAEANKIGEEATGWVQATTTTVSVTAEKPTKKEGELTVVVDKAFFRVVVDDQDHTPPLAEQE